MKKITLLPALLAAFLMYSCSEKAETNEDKKEEKIEVQKAAKEETKPAVAAPEKVDNAAVLNTFIANMNDPSTAAKLKDWGNGDIGKGVYTGDATPEKLIAAAKKYEGVPYKDSGKDENGMDASGFVAKAFKDVGVELPPMAVEMARYGNIISDKAQLQAGDLVFYGNTYETKKAITFVGIFLGDGNVIMVSSKKGVHITEFDDPYYWNDKYLFATRVF